MAFGRLERTQGPQPFSEINVTPLVDVMLVLVVIFIVTAPLLASAIRLDLPRSEVAQPGDAPRFVSITVEAAGFLFLNDQRINDRDLAERLMAIGRQNPETEIQLRGDRNTPYGRVVEVMGMAQKAGLNRVAFVAERPAQ